MFNVEKIFVRNEDVSLEAEYYTSRSDKTKGCLICHPHPQFGGNMHNNVVSGAFNAFINADISCMRFNFRAVENSTGEHSDGEGELSDVKACVDFLKNEKKLENIFICGYSYGAAVGCAAANYSEKIIGYVAISFPWDFMGSEFKKLSQSNKPKLFLQGDRDNIALYSKFQKHYDSYSNPKEFKIIKGADHFYVGYEKEISSIVVDFYTKLIKQEEKIKKL